MFRPTRRTLLAGAGAILVVAVAIVLAALWMPDLFLQDYEPAPVFASDGIAIRGTDPVAYFTQGRPVAGSPAYSADWRGATWLFSTAAHRDAFLAEPEAYAPQYGGFCAWAVAEKGKLYSTQPENWTIVAGKLYLNYNDAVQAKWESDSPAFIEAGDRRWPGIIEGAL